VNLESMPALLARNDSSLSVSFTPEALALQAAALESAALVGRVSSADEQLAAVEAQKQLAGVLKAVEASRVDAKAPVIVYGRTIDEAAKGFSSELLAEQLRLSKLVADFQALEMAKVRAAQAAENKRLADLERERQRALAEAKSHEQLDAVNSEFDQRTRDEAPPPVAPVRAEGQIVKEEWQFEIQDVWALARAHPNCVKAPEPRRLEIKSLLDSGVKVVGVRAWKETKSTVRVEKAGALQIA
jgi:hypothetical protein